VPSHSEYPCPGMTCRRHSEQDDENVCLLDVVHAIAWPAVDTQLGDAFTHWLHVSWISEGEPTDPNVDARLRRPIAKTREPLCVLRSLADFKH